MLSGNNPAYALAHQRRIHRGGSGIPSNNPGEVARCDHIQITIDGVVKHGLFIVYEATMHCSVHYCPYNAYFQVARLCDTNAISTVTVFARDKDQSQSQEVDVSGETK